MSIRFDGEVAIITGAGNGLGRSHALALAERGAKIIVNDLGGARDGSGASSSAAQVVVDEIIAAGGEAMANGADVSDYAQVEAMVKQAMDAWGRVDILINNAGILRDKTFAKMDLEDFRLILDVHVMGSVNCTKAVWEIMREQAYGRILMTTSASGMYGNFGQSNYSTAKMAVLGFMNTLVLEGAKYNIHVNALAPTAGTRLTEDIVTPEMYEALTPESVTAGALVLCHKDAPSRMILCAGGGGFASTRLFETNGVFLTSKPLSPEDVQASMAAICDTSEQTEMNAAIQQIEKFVTMATAKT